MVLLVTSDNEQFVVEKDVAERSVLIKNMLEGNSFYALLLRHPNARLLYRCRRKRPADTATQCLIERFEKGKHFRLRGCRFFLIIVSLTQVLEYCEHHRGERLPTTDAESQDETRKRTTDISEWDQKFIAVDQEMLFEIILAANYLDIKPLLSVLNAVNPKHP